MAVKNDDASLKIPNPKFKIKNNNGRVSARPINPEN